VVHCSRQANGRREVTEILSLGRRVENGIIESSSVFAMADGVLQPRANAMPEAEKFSRAGYDVTALLDPR
jgi:pilus assembly protein CpaF